MWIIIGASIVSAVITSVVVTRILAIKYLKIIDGCVGDVMNKIGELVGMAESILHKQE